MAFAAFNLHQPHQHHALPPVRSLKRPISQDDHCTITISNNLRLRSRKCLFGATDPIDTMRMVKENLQAERARFFDRFGVHIEDLDRHAIDEDEHRRRMKKVGGKLKMRSSRVLRPYNAQQSKITDYCQVKKSPEGSRSKCGPGKSPPIASSSSESSSSDSSMKAPITMTDSLC